MKRIVVLILIVGLTIAACADFTEYVDPFVGTTATGHTTPAAAYPFGMVQAGPTTGTITWQYCSGYRHEDKAVTGYALTALSGTGFCEYNELQVLPFSGERGAMPMKREIDKTTEKAKPGYYAVKQSEDGVAVEIVAAKRAAIYRFAWEKGRGAKVLVNLPYGNGQADGNQFAGSHDGKVTKFGDGRIEGEHFRTGCIMRRKIAFALEFNRPWSACEELPKEKPDELPRYVLSFDLNDGELLLLKSAFSINSPDAARRNLVSSIPAWDFEGVKSATRTAWNEVLSRSTCEGTDEQKRNWYTSLYHLYFQPNDYSDADDAKPYYTTLSLWDTFRACHPWYSIVASEVNASAVDSFMRHYRTFGRLPVMSYGGMNFDCMIGNHSVPVIVDRFLKAKSDEVDWNAVFDAVKNTLMVAHPGKPKENWDVYDKYGYFPYDVIEGEGVSRTFECAYDDWCAAQMAKGLGKADDYQLFMRRSQNWKNVFDSSGGFARGKSSDGKWREPFDPFAFGHGAGRDNDFTEGNAFQYSWHVMHDVEGLVAAMGGREAALKKLETLFTADATAAGAPPDVTGLIGQYVHGNEPSHHVIYLFSLLGRSDLTAKYVREVFDRFYLPKSDGLCGNDDCGQMSAWYLFSAMGFYPFNPCGGEYIIGAPQVEKATVFFTPNSSFTVVANGLSRENKYVKSVTFNGKQIENWKIRHADIVSGGVLMFEMWDGKDPKSTTCSEDTIVLSPDGPSTLSVYRPVGRVGRVPAIVICPGGGYRELCDTYEGDDMARWLAARGVAAFVLRYRLSPHWHKDAMLSDVRQALQCVRGRANEWLVDPRRVGVLGFSAGGHLACMAGTVLGVDRADFMALVYPHVSMRRGVGNEHMRVAFLGEGYSDSELDHYSGEMLVTGDTPPTFLVHARTDEICSIEHSRRFVDAMHKHGRDVDFCELTLGRHGLGCGMGEDWELWLSAFDKWLQKKVLR